jgi:crotonobetainyl-CoA:carnitine CoA-transferase CaiB-like acyl-CoA transferase
MQRLPDLPGFAYFRERGFYRETGHRWLKETVFAESFVVPSADLPPPPQNDAPLSGEQTHEVVADWLGLDADRIADLVEQAILEPLPAETRNSAERYMARE